MCYFNFLSSTARSFSRWVSCSSWLCFAAAIFCLGSIAGTEAGQTPTVLVSISPYKFLVSKIAGETVRVEVMVPPGASAHTYEPTPKQMVSASRAAIWFQIGEGFESRAAQALKSHHPGLQLIDLRQGLQLISESCCGHQHASCSDPHFWLSPKECKIQAVTIADALSEEFPQHKEFYQTNVLNLLKELDRLNDEITAILKPLKNRVVMVAHPAYAYFCRDYRLKQLSIEFEGKDPTPQQLTRILTEARDYHIKTIFVQPQYSSKGARLIADKIGGRVETLDPYAENIFKSLLQIAHAFASQYTETY